MDWIEEWVAEWTREQPDLDYSSLSPLIRLARLTNLFESFQGDVLAPFELTPGEYAVLATLRRDGRSDSLRPSQLCDRLRRSSGGMTKILKRLEKLELVERSPDPEDGRGSRITLTTRGHSMHDRVFRAFTLASNRLIGELPAATKQDIDRAMKALLDHLDGGPTDGRPSTEAH